MIAWLKSGKKIPILRVLVEEGAVPAVQRKRRNLPLLGKSEKGARKPGELTKLGALWDAI